MSWRNIFKKEILKDKLNKYEFYFFYLILVINLIPVLVFKFFPTVDGPAHLYNSNLIIELLGQNNLLNNYFTINEITANCLGHGILSVFQLIFPAYIAEKCLLLIYFVGFPISFRALIKTQSNINRSLIYFVFPFTYSFLLYYGFYNFHIGLVLFFWALYLWVKHKNEYTIRRTLYLLILTTLMCLSHLFVFAMFLLVLVILNVSELKFQYKSNKIIRKRLFKNLLYQFFFISVGLILMFKFIFFNNQGNSISTYIKSSDLLTWLVQIQPAKGIEYGKEGTFTRWIFILLILLILYILYVKVKRFFFSQSKDDNTNLVKHKNNSWLLISCIFLVCLFIFPDSKGAAVGFISSRMILFFFLFLIIWLSTYKVPVWLNIIVFILINYVNIALVKVYYNSSKENNIITNEIYQASLKIDPYKTVLPINNSDNWLCTHISNYLGAEKPMVILENYEASLGHFPLKWNYDKFPNLYFGEVLPQSGCISWESNVNNDVAVIDYIFILNGEQKTISVDCENKIFDILANDYIEVYKSEDNNILLYKFKSDN
ncbi:MAG: hypothetical protein ABIJ97_08320 [Bacteroidota bacterium]